MPESVEAGGKRLAKRLVCVLVSAPVIFLCLVIAGFAGCLGLRIFLSSHYMKEAVRTCLGQDLNCEVALSRAGLSPMGTLVLENLSLSYRKADGLHEVFKSDRAEVEFEPLSLFESRLRFTALRFRGAALALERDSEGWLTLGRIVRPAANRPGFSVTVQATDSTLRVGDASVPVEFFSAQVSRAKDRVDLVVKESSLLDGGVEGSGHVMMQEDPLIHGEFKFRGISLASLFGENKEPGLDVRGVASCDLVVDGRASSAQLLTPGSRLAIKDFSVALSEGPSGKPSAPIVAASRLDLCAASSRVGGGALLLDLAAEQPEISLPGLLACRGQAGLIPASQRAAALLSKMDRIEVNMSGSRLRVQHPRLSAVTEKFEGRLMKTGEKVSLQGFKARLWGGDIEANASLGQLTMNWLVEGNVGIKDLGLQNAPPLAFRPEAASEPAKVVKLGGWLSGEFTFRARRQAEPVFTGNGSVAVRRAQLWDLPVFACVAGKLALPAEATGEPQEFRGAFAADGDKLSFSRLELASDRVKLFGRGTAQYSGSLDLDFGLNVMPRKQEPGQGLFGLFGAGQKHRASVSGYLDSPEATLGEGKD